MQRLDTREAGFDDALRRLTAFDEAQDTAVTETVAAIIADVNRRGDAALLEYTARFDGLEADRKSVV